MAFLLKNTGAGTRYSTVGHQPVVDQWIRVSRPSDTTPQTATETLFEVEGGRILMKALVGEVTVVQGATASNLSIVIDSDAGAADDLASAVATANDAVGIMYTVEGDGTALLKAGIGWGQACLGLGVVIAPGAIRLTASGSNTGEIKWDLYFLPLDEAAYVTATAV